jgi:hypothetical protein
LNVKNLLRVIRKNLQKQLKPQVGGCPFSVASPAAIHWGGKRKSGSRAAALQEGAIFPKQSLTYLARKSREI